MKEEREEKKEEEREEEKKGEEEEKKGGEEGEKKGEEEEEKKGGEEEEKKGEEEEEKKGGEEGEKKGGEEEEEKVRTIAIKSWDDFHLPESLLRGIYAMGFEAPSEIQKQAIPVMLAKRDLLAQAQSGTGKTASFSIGVLAHIQLGSHLRHPQALFISPTRELANQTASVIRTLGMYMEGLSVEVLVGGIRWDDIKYKQPQIICGCPGKLLDMITKRFLLVRFLTFVVLDEVDQLLTSEFNQQLHDIFQTIPAHTNVALFSATIPVSIQPFVDKILQHDPVSICLHKEQLTLDGIEQFYVVTQNDDTKYDQLKAIYQQLVIGQSVLFCNRVSRVVELHQRMSQDGYPVICIHSNMTKEEREDVLKEFRSGKYRILLSTDLTARGIDVQQVRMVVNVDIPQNVHTYLHRIGRSGRWGRKGVAINFVTQRDVLSVRNIEEHYKIEWKDFGTFRPDTSLT